MTLFEINREYEALMEQFVGVDEDRVVDTETGEVMSKEDFDSLFVAMQGKRDEKIRAVCMKVKDLEVKAAAVKSIMDGYKKRYEAYANGSKRLTEYLAYCLQGEKFECPEAAVKYTKSKAVEFNGNIGDVPEEYLKFKDPELDKVAVKKALQAGKEVPGCHIVERVSMKVK